MKMHYQYNLSRKLKLLSALVILFCCSCTNIKQEPDKTNAQLVRLTVYWKTEDKWTARGKTATGKPLQSYKTIAADPRDFPYHSNISIPELNIKGTVHDTGSALKTRKAARKLGKDVPVLDLYIQNKKEALAFAKKAPMFVTVICEQ